MDQFYFMNWCGTEQSLREYLAEAEHWRHCHPELMNLKRAFEAGHLPQETNLAIGLLRR